MEWILANWTKIAEVVAAVIGVASIIVKLTPNLKDDAFLLPIVKFVAKFIALNKNSPTEEERPQ
jgi:hypothetical protein